MQACGEVQARSPVMALAQGGDLVVQALVQGGELLVPSLFGIGVGHRASSRRSVDQRRKAAVRVARVGGAALVTRGLALAAATVSPMGTG